MAPEGGYSFGEVRRLTGLSPYQLRHYERSRLLGAIQRDHRGWRRYSEADLKRLRRMAEARREGLDVRDLRALSTGDAGRILDRIEAAAEEAIARVQAVRVMARSIRPESREP